MTTAPIQHRMLGVKVFLGLVLGCFAFSIALATGALNAPSLNPFQLPPALAPIATPTSAPSPTPGPELAQSRTGAALPVWASPGAAYVAVFDPRLAASRLQCTIPPFTDVQVVERNVGWASWQLSEADRLAIHLLPGQASDVIGRIASADGRCMGYVAAALLTAR